MKKYAWILCAILFMVSGCSTNALQKYTVNLSDVGFDTFVSFIGYTENQTQFDTYAATLQTEFKKYDKLFDKYKAYDDIPNIKTINDQAGIKPVKVDPIIIELLTLAKTYDELSDHHFDITMGAVLDVWHTYREEGSKANEQGKEASIPTKTELKQADANRGWEHIIINESENSVYIDKKGVSLDVGGIAKGFAVEKIAQLLEAEGLQHAIINAGGNVRLIGDKPNSEYWSVGVQIPDIKNLETDSLISLKIDNSSSFVTSGDYQRYYVYQGELMHHIIDPQTLYPAKHCRSVTVICKNSSLADIISTTLYTMSYEEGNQFLNKLKEQEGLEVDAIWVYDEDVKPETGTTPFAVKDYQISVSEGLKDNIIK